jgi:hypothetical protein
MIEGPDPGSPIRSAAFSADGHRIAIACEDRTVSMWIIEDFSETQAGDGNRAMASAVIVIVLTMAAYNVFAVIVLQSSNPSVKGADWRQLMRTIGRFS